MGASDRVKSEWRYWATVPPAMPTAGQNPSPQVSWFSASSSQSGDHLPPESSYAVWLAGREGPRRRLRITGLPLEQRMNRPL